MSAVEICWVLNILDW